MQIDRSQAPDLIERLGIVIWKIAVLLIALHCILGFIPQQGVRDGLSIGGVVLQGSALVLISVGAGWAAIRALRARAPWHPHPRPARRRRDVTHTIRKAEAPLAPAATRGLPHLMWRGANWMLALGLESMLAAQIIQVSIISAGQNQLSWWRISVIVMIAIGRILL